MRSMELRQLDAGEFLSARARRTTVLGVALIMAGGAGARDPLGACSSSRGPEFLFDHLRHQVQPVLHLRRDRLVEPACWSVSVTPSSRRRCTTSWAWAIGAMPSVSTDLHLLDQALKMSFSWPRVGVRFGIGNFDAGAARRCALTSVKDQGHGICV